MTVVLTILHVFVCLVLIAAVLLQSGKAADLAGAFGGGGSSTAFGPRGTQSIMARLTTICAILFMVTSFALWRLGSQSGSVVKPEAQPAKPAAAETSTTAPQSKADQPADAAAKAPETTAAPAQKPEPAKK